MTHAVDVLEAVGGCAEKVERVIVGLEVSDLSIQLAETNLTNEKILAAAGDSRAFDVLARVDELARARLARERAVVDELMAVAQVDALTGDLLADHGVDVATGHTR